MNHRLSPRLPSLAGVLLALTALAAPAAAQDVDCSNPTAQMEMTYCAEQDWNAADAALNAAYARAMDEMRRIDADLAGLPHLVGAVDALRAAQRAWIPYRDKACAAQGFMARGGTMEPMLIYQCRADLTRQRTQELEALAAGLGN
ncbi:lysozyme inhibitor LprI family protein [Stappia sp.]|uniref:lysozyme inhibitor LprI family protein n=1 Tax=Stappia sp. TaxID=1870903 RepID=UPI0032D93C24